MARGSELRTPRPADRPGARVPRPPTRPDRTRLRLLHVAASRGRTMISDTGIGLSTDPLWYKDAIIYEAPVKSFYDGSAEGNGDFRGLTQKLDYLHDLGITAIWILPFYPSPLNDDGYDIADYTTVHPQYGTLDDFKELLREARHRGI